MVVHGLYSVSVATGLETRETFRRFTRASKRRVATLSKVFQIKKRMSILTQQCVVTISPFPCVFSLEFFGVNENYTFLESLESCESENQCWHFFQAPLGRYLDSKWRLFFFKMAISWVVTIL